MENKIRGWLTILSVSMLAACGGEEVITLAHGNPTPDVFANVPAAANLQGPFAVSTYASPTVQLAFDELNGARGRCGFGYWNKSPLLEKAAAAHANYLSVNNRLSHTEKPGLPGFTGVEVTDRAYAAGWDARYGVGEAAVYGTDDGATIARSLLSATYHLGGIIGSSQTVGMAGAYSPAGQFFFVANLADNQYLGQRLQKNTVATYPCQGETIEARHSNESPSPFPGVSLAGLGSPFAVKSRDGQTLTVKSHSISAGGVPIATALLTGANDPAGIIIPSYAYVIPLSPLVSGGSYMFDAAGDVYGVSFKINYTVNVR